MTATATKQTKQSLVTCVSHPLRAACWIILAEREASPSDIAKELLADLPDVSYHVKKLESAGVIELAATRPVRGAVEHIYRATQRPVCSTADTAALSPSERLANARHICQLVFADAARALDTETFCSRPEHAAVRIPLQLDEEGWQEVAEIQTAVYEQIMDAQARSNERRVESGEESIAATAVTLFFETPPRKRVFGSA